ncbi:MAG: Hsp33 family molecular chaperone HslO [Ruminococcaceae bacterium]|nr:Hsp33 family molecular chaperone HslO [Oscillospiraceae bacterium]
MGKLIRCITSCGAVMAAAVDATDIVKEAQRIHKLSPVATVALGRLLAGASMMGNALKNKDDSVTLRIAGDGPLGSLIAVSDSCGNVRGYVSNAAAEVPLNNKGQLDVASAVGREGMLYVLKDIGLKEPYNGSVPLFSGEIAEDITAYYAISEQIPTVCALSVSLNNDGSVSRAGGYLIQMMPFATEDEIKRLEDGIKEMSSLSSMFAQNMSLFDIIKKALKYYEVEVLDESSAEYLCNCSRARVEKALISIGKEGLLEMANEQDNTNIECHFCDKTYNFSAAQLRKLASK